MGLHVDMSEDYSEKIPLLGMQPNNSDFLDQAVEMHSEFNSSEVDANKRMHMVLTAFFMNPIEKWRIRRRFPFKMCFQILIIILGIFQMYGFGEEREKHLNQNSEMTIALNKMFLKNWKFGDLGHPYINSFYAVYSEFEFFENVDFVVQQFANLDSLNFGRYGYDNQNGIPSPLILCTKAYKGQVDPEKLVINIQNSPQEKCLVIAYTRNDSNIFSISNFLLQSNNTLNFRTLIQVNIKFQLRTIVFKSMNELGFSNCYRLNITILYDKTNHDGHIPISLKIYTDRINCQVSVNDAKDNKNRPTWQPLNMFIIVFSLMSIALCVRSLYRSFKLSQEAAWFFHYFHGKTIPFSEKMDFIDFWYVTILAGNLMVVLGSCLKLQIEANSTRLTEGTGCSFLLGIGYLLSSMGTLRYFRLFPNYNILIETLKKSIPKLVRFLICVILLFIGYCFCGWMALAPYHSKFTTLSNTAESLFAAMNGDGMYEIFTMLYTDLPSVWWFAKIYMYSFFFLFFYLGASLLGSVILDAYETVKDMCANGKTPSTTVEIFLATEQYEPISPAPSISNLHFPENNLSSFQKILEWLYHH